MTEWDRELLRDTENQIKYLKSAVNLFEKDYNKEDNDRKIRELERLIADIIG